MSLLWHHVSYKKSIIMGIGGAQYIHNGVQNGVLYVLGTSNSQSGKVEVPVMVPQVHSAQGENKKFLTTTNSWPSQWLFWPNATTNHKMHEMNITSRLIFIRLIFVKWPQHGPTGAICMCDVPELFEIKH
jgi:hypothetical protein